MTSAELEDANLRWWRCNPTGVRACATPKAARARPYSGHPTANGLPTFPDGLGELGPGLRRALSAGLMAKCQLGIDVGFTQDPYSDPYFACPPLSALSAETDALVQGAGP